MISLWVHPYPLWGQGTVIWAKPPLGQMRFLYSHMRTEFAGCLYGQIAGDTTRVLYFISGQIDPREATDSGVPQGGCPKIAGDTLLAIAHSHIRPGSLCVPSAKDEFVFDLWHRRFGVRLGVIMCAAGDSVAMFSDSAFGVWGLPPLDSLYARP